MYVSDIFYLKKIRRPTYEKFLKINFQLYIVLILHENSHGLCFQMWRIRVQYSWLARIFSLHFCHYYILIYHFLICFFATTRNNDNTYTNSKLDQVRYPQVCYENKIDCKLTVGKFSRKMIYCWEICHLSLKSKATKPY
jgi:hypothetical protein